MAIVVVGGHSRNVGKTSVVAGLIAGLPEFHWTAFKITQYGHGFCTADGKPCQCQTEDSCVSLTAEQDRSQRHGHLALPRCRRCASIWVRTRIGMLGEAMPRIEKELADVRERDSRIEQHPRLSGAGSLPHGSRSGCCRLQSLRSPLFRSCRCCIDLVEQSDRRQPPRCARRETPLLDSAARLHVRGTGRFCACAPGASCGRGQLRGFSGSRFIAPSRCFTSISTLPSASSSCFPAFGRQASAFLKKLHRLFQREIPALQLGDDLFQLCQRLLKAGQRGSPPAVSRPVRDGYGLAEPPRGRPPQRCNVRRAR